MFRASGWRRDYSEIESCNDDNIFVAGQKKKGKSPARAREQP